MTYHSYRKIDENIDRENASEVMGKSGVLKCHYCGYRSKLPSKCKECGHEEFDYVGFGTQRAEDELSKVFSLVKNYLNPGGIFVFDINTPYKYEQVLSNNTFVHDENDVFYVWQNFFDGEYCDFLIDFFVKKDNSYSRFTEEHTQRCHTFKEMLEIIEKSGLSLEAVYDDLRFSDPVQNSERMFFVVKKEG
jgi:hypothetical protein